MSITPDEDTSPPLSPFKMPERIGPVRELTEAEAALGPLPFFGPSINVDEDAVAADTAEEDLDAEPVLSPATAEAVAVPLPTSPRPIDFATATAEPPTPPAAGDESEFHELLRNLFTASKRLALYTLGTSYRKLGQSVEYLIAGPPVVKTYGLDKPQPKIHLTEEMKRMNPSNLHATELEAPWSIMLLENSAYMPDPLKSPAPYAPLSGPIFDRLPARFAASIPQSLHAPERSAWRRAWVPYARAFREDVLEWTRKAPNEVARKGLEAIATSVLEDMAQVLVVNEDIRLSTPGAAEVIEQGIRIAQRRRGQRYSYMSESAEKLLEEYVELQRVHGRAYQRLARGDPFRAHLHFRPTGPVEVVVPYKERVHFYGMLCVAIFGLLAVCTISLAIFAASISMLVRLVFNVLNYCLHGLWTLLNNPSTITTALAQFVGAVAAPLAQVVGAVTTALAQVAGALTSAVLALITVILRLCLHYGCRALAAVESAHGSVVYQTPLPHGVFTPAAVHSWLDTPWLPGGTANEDICLTIDDAFLQCPTAIAGAGAGGLRIFDPDCARRAVGAVIREEW